MKVNPTRYYDQFSKIYDWVSPGLYYRKARQYAINQLHIEANQTILNIPCGTGQNFKYFEEKFQQTGQIIGVDLSEGMLNKALRKIEKNGWTNCILYQEDATKINQHWVDQTIKPDLKFDSILCDLGLSGFPDWELVIDNLIDLLKPKGRIVILDWYINKPSLRSRFIKWVGKGEVDRPIYQYLESKLSDFELNNTFKQGDLFVATGIKGN